MRARRWAAWDDRFPSFVIHDTAFPLIDRFQIEDLIVQDFSGVVFRAVDTETGLLVAVRRFFPFGADGGGLDPDEQTAYNIAINRLAGIDHPALRAVVCGGCDPVDGIPFIATEWVDGNAIEPLVRQQAFPPAVAADLLVQALEACELLSQVLAEEAVWVETDLNTIILGSETSGRGFTFWISPLKWLGGNDRSRGLESLITLTEELMGWQGLVVNDQAGQGLGAWLNWLRREAPAASLREARENLAAALGTEPPVQVKELLKASQQRPRPSGGSAKSAAFSVIGFSLVIIGAAGWLWSRQCAANDADAQKSRVAHIQGGMGGEPLMPAAAPPASSEVAAVNERAAQLAAQSAEASRREKQTLDAQQAAIAARGGVFSPAEGTLLAMRKGQEETLEGTLHGVVPSSSGKTLYLQFSQSPAKDEPGGSVQLSKADDDLNEDLLRAYIGKKIRITGKVEVARGKGARGPQIALTKRSQISEIQ